jgi:hypothetical protein
VWLLRVTLRGGISGWKSSSVSALCVQASCGQHRGGPRARQEGDMRVAHEDVHPARREDEQVGLLGVELEGDEAGGRADRADMQQARAARDATGGLDDDVAQAPRAVLVGAQVAATEQLGRELAGGEARLDAAGAGGHRG